MAEKGSKEINSFLVHIFVSLFTFLFVFFTPLDYSLNKYGGIYVHRPDTASYLSLSLSLSHSLLIHGNRPVPQGTGFSSTFSLNRIKRNWRLPLKRLASCLPVKYLLLENAFPSLLMGRDSKEFLTILSSFRDYCLAQEQHFLSILVYYT